MDNSQASQGSYNRVARPARPNATRLTVTLILATVGSVAGGILWVPLGVILPFWFSLTLPQLFAAVFASSMAYLVAGPTKAMLSRIVAVSLVISAVCAVLNLLLFTNMVPGITATDDLAPPGGIATLLLEALAIGTVAGIVATRGRQRQPRSWVPFAIALSVSILAVVLLLLIGSAVLPVLWMTPNSA